MDDFNFDPNDIELDENGEPIEDGLDEEQDNLDGEQPQYERASKNKKESTSTTSSNETSSQSGGRFGDKPPNSTNKLTKDSTTKPQVPKLNTEGGDNWFSKLTNFFNKGSGSGKVGSQLTQKASTNVIRFIAPAIPYVLIVLLIILVITSILGSITAFFENKTNPTNMANNSYITDEYFYGIRTVYIDEEDLLNSLQLSYKQYAVDVFTILDNDPSLTINITLPEEFDNITEIDTHFINISIAIGNIVANNSSTYQNITFETLYPNIQYFGLTVEQGEQASEFLCEYIANNNLITINEGGDSIKTVVQTALDSEKLQYIYNICEKVMIKDELATATGITNVEQRKYIASIYMPNKDIVVANLIYSVVNENDDFATHVKLIEENNSNQTIHKEKSIEDHTEVIMGFSAGEVGVKQFSSIDDKNLQAFSTGVSLFEAIRMSPEYASFFTQDEETDVYSWKPTDSSLLYLTFESTNKFIFNDFNLEVKSSTI